MTMAGPDQAAMQFVSFFVTQRLPNDWLLSQLPRRSQADIGSAATLPACCQMSDGKDKNGQPFLAGALYRAFREFMRILTTFLGKRPQKSIIIRMFRPFVLIMMDFCGFFQGKSSEFA